MPKHGVGASVRARVPAWLSEGGYHDLIAGDGGDAAAGGA